ncbi:MAG TPA: shikimate dehydrogenase [Xanthobacteraceae bacterium]|nr:shikimate dehydrogenase [Xanthobacteraceae bacterium]
MSHPDRFLLAGVMGDPVMHSRSPKLHNYWLAKYGVTGIYVPLAITAANLRAALRALSALGFSGCNLTIPHKEAALDIVDKLDPLARRIGAVNCVVVAPDGSLEGRNHDGFGYIESVREAQPEWRADTGPIVVIGAGGGARAVLVSLIDQGAREIRLVNRTLARGKALAGDLGGPITALAWEKREAALEGAAMLINATNQGMLGEPPLDLALDRLPVRALVSDIVYIPRETALLAAARRRGNATVNGLGMLLHQARPAFHAWFGIMPEVTPELRAMIEATT